MSTENLHPIHGEFWQHQEKVMLAEVQGAHPGSVRQMVANQFLLGAQHQVRLIEEHAKAISMLPWAFYSERAAMLKRQICGNERGI